MTRSPTRLGRLVFMNQIPVHLDHPKSFKTEQYIFMVRDQQVMLDRDLASLYGVETKVLNQAVKRNIARFPEPFRFQLTQLENDQLVTDCDQFAKP